MVRIVLAVVVVACGTPGPPVRSAQQRTTDSAPVIATLQASRFDKAGGMAEVILQRDPRNAQAAAVRALATYQAAGQALVLGLGEAIERAGVLKAFDHDLAVAAADPGFALSCAWRAGSTTGTTTRRPLRG